jgi:hypothetical protein
MIEPTTVLHRNPRVEYRTLANGEGTVLLNLETAAYHGLNEIGSWMWNRLDGLTFGELLKKLREELEEAPPNLEREVSAFLLDLNARELITCTNSRSAWNGEVP